MKAPVIPGDGPTRTVLPVRDVDPDRLRAAIEAAHPSALLMVLVHMTGDRSLLGEFRELLAAATPAGAGRATVAGRYPPEVEQAVRRRALEVLTTDLVPVIDAPDDALFHEMVEVATDDSVGPEYVPYLREQAGFGPAPEKARVREPGRAGFRVIVVGAGMIGINAAVELAGAGIDYEVFEAGADIGGTWSRNVYPGAAVDTPSHFYSYSFELNPTWTKFFPTGPEYLRYIQHVADKYAVRDRIHLNTRVLGCAWDEQQQLWRVTVGGPDGHTAVHEAHAVITATGVLNGASVPDVPGAESFAGPAMHTAQWDPTVDLSGKRVVVLGAGCTAVQVVASIAGDAAHVDVVCRQPHWMTPERNVVVDVDDDTRWALSTIPYYHQWYRLVTHWITGDNIVPITRIDPEWAATHLSVSPANDTVLQVCMKHLRDELPDRPDLVEKLTPDFPPFGKRIVKDPGFLAALRRDDVSLHRATFDRIVPDGVHLSTGEFVPADVIVWATGFHLEYLNYLDVVGRDGRTLADEWDGGTDPRAYLGITVPGFPNFFVTAGPNAAPNHGGGHNVTSEEHVHYAVECLKFMIDNGHRAMEPTPEATRAYNERVDAELDTTVWQHAGTANGYYRNAAGRAWVSCPWRLVDFWTMLRAPAPEDHRLEPAREIDAVAR